MVVNSCSKVWARCSLIPCAVHQEVVEGPGDHGIVYRISGKQTISFLIDRIPLKMVNFNLPQASILDFGAKRKCWKLEGFLLDFPLHLTKEKSPAFLSKLESLVDVLTTSVAIRPVLYFDREFCSMNTKIKLRRRIKALLNWVKLAKV